MIAALPIAQAGKRIVKGNEVASDLALTADVCVVGSGAGGAVLAAELAQAGKKVVLLEEGGHYTRADFNMQEEKMLPLLYQEKAGRFTADQSIGILQGRAIGGSTVINYTTCYRTPDSTLAHWKDRWGVEGLDAQTLGPAWDKVEARLGIQEIAFENTNKNNRVISTGCGKLGWEWHLLKRNVRNCLHSGYCGVGCPYDAKQSMHVTYVLDALEAGATIHANARVERLERDDNRIAKVHAVVLDPVTDKPTGRTITVTAARVAVAGGAINSPRLLMRSGILEGNVGKRGWFHPLCPSVGIMPYRVEPFYGAPQSIGSRHFADRGKNMGYFIETAAMHPVLASMALPGFGAGHREFMEKLANINFMYAHFVDGFSDEESGATVTMKPDGGLKVDYALVPRFWESVKDALKNMARIQLAAGATEVRTLHAEPVVCRSEADLSKIDDAPYGPNRLVLATAHLMGGCQMGKDPKTSVVRSDLRHHVVENLWIVDGSVFPSSLGVNPSHTIYGLATHAARAIGG